MTDQTTPLRDRIAAAARTIQLRLGSNAVAMAQRGEPIILNLNEADDLADAVLAAVLPATTNHDTDTVAAWAPCSPEWLRAMPAGACSWAPRKAGDGVGVSHYHPALPAPVDRAAVLREAADRLPDADLPFVSPMGRRQTADWLRRMADETAATETQPAALLRVVARWAASSEGRDVLVEELADAGYRLPHACGNCEGIDPDTCLKNPDRRKRPPMDPVHILGIEADDGPAAGVRQDETVAVPCVECDHPQTDHGEGEDPVTPGQCQACPDDDAWHDYQAATKQQDGAQPGDAE